MLGDSHRVVAGRFFLFGALRAGQGEGDAERNGQAPGNAAGLHCCFPHGLVGVLKA